MNKNDAFPSKYLTAADLDGKPALFTIAYVTIEELTDRQTGKTNKKPCVYFQNQEKGMVCNVTNWDTISSFLGDESNDWTGKEIVLFPDRVSFGRDMKLGIRVREPRNRRSPTATASAKPKPATPDPAIDEEIPF